VFSFYTVAEATKQLLDLARGEDVVELDLKENRIE